MTPKTGTRVITTLALIDRFQIRFQKIYNICKLFYNFTCFLPGNSVMNV